VDFAEGHFLPVYERVFDRAGVGPGIRLLDIGCGAGLATCRAAERGAEVAGLDAAEASIAIARERAPHGDFRVGEMEELPWPDATFDIVTSFNGFQFAADMDHALCEARRVARPGGRVAMVVWGPDGTCDIPPIMGAVLDLLPPRPFSAQASVPLSAPGRMEALLTAAGLTIVTGGEVDTVFEFSDLEAALRGLMAAGAAVAVIDRVGLDPVRRTVAEALAPFRTPAGGYRLRNRFSYVIASN
jgi:SAM-dependent methyltransferase